MNKFIVIASVVAFASAMPQFGKQQAGFAQPASKDALAVITHQQFDQNVDGSYNYQYETSNGISAAQSSPNGQDSQGQFSFTAPDGVRYSIQYAANEGGFQPQGAHLPVPPADLPVPDHVLKTLETIRQNPPRNDPNYNPAALDAEIARLRATLG